MVEAGLADVDAEFEEFAMNARGAPRWDSPGTFGGSDPEPHEDNRASGLAVPRFSCPEQAKALAMPGHDSFRLHDDQG